MSFVTGIKVKNSVYLFSSPTLFQPFFNRDCKHALTSSEFPQARFTSDFHSMISYQLPRNSSYYASFDKMFNVIATLSKTISLSVSIFYVLFCGNHLRRSIGQLHGPCKNRILLRPYFSDSCPSHRFQI